LGRTVDAARRSKRDNPIGPLSFLGWYRAVKHKPHPQKETKKEKGSSRMQVPWSKDLGEKKKMGRRVNERIKDHLKVFSG